MPGEAAAPLRSAETAALSPARCSRSAPRRFRVPLPAKASPPPPPGSSPQVPAKLSARARVLEARPRCRPSLGGSNCSPGPGEGRRRRRPAHAPQPGTPQLPAWQPRSFVGRAGGGWWGGRNAAAAPSGGTLFPGGTLLPTDRRGKRGGGGGWLSRRRRWRGRAPLSPRLPGPAGPGASPSFPFLFPFLTALPLPRQPAGRRGAEGGGSHAQRRQRRRRRRRGGSGSGRAAVAAMGGPGGLRRARRLCHWGPLVALAVVAVCSATAMADAALWYWPLDTAGGSVNFIMLLNWTVMILYNYFSAMFVGPGYVPLGWTPVSAGWRWPRPRAGLGGAGGGGWRACLPLCWGRPLGKEGVQGSERPQASLIFRCHRYPFLPEGGSRPLRPLLPPYRRFLPLSRFAAASSVSSVLQFTPSLPCSVRCGDLGLNGRAALLAAAVTFYRCFSKQNNREHTSPVSREPELQGYLRAHAGPVVSKALLLVISIRRASFSNFNYFFLTSARKLRADLMFSTVL